MSRMLVVSFAASPLPVALGGLAAASRDTARHVACRPEETGRADGGPGGVDRRAVPAAVGARGDHRTGRAIAGVRRAVNTRVPREPAAADVTKVRPIPYSTKALRSRLP